MQNTARVRNREAIALLLKRTRRYALLSQGDVARALNISRRSVSAYEGGDTEIPATIVLEWLRVCGRPIDDLATACAPWDSNPEPADSIGDDPTSPFADDRLVLTLADACAALP